MSFAGVSAATIAATVSATTAVAGLGLSAASAAGAFNGKVDKRGPTPEELSAADINRSVYEQGRKQQEMLDPVYLKRLNLGDKTLADAKQRYEDAKARLEPYGQRLNQLDSETQRLNDGRFYRQAADTAVNQAWQKIPDATQVGQTAGVRSGVGSGAFMSAMNNQNMDASGAVEEANVHGREGWLGNVNNYRNKFTGNLANYGQRMAGVGSYLDQYGNVLANQSNQAENLYNDYGTRVQTGLGLVNQGAGQAANAQNNRITAQIAQNQARAQAMGQIGGALTSAGMAGMSAAGGLGGGSGPGFGAETGPSVFRSELQQAAQGPYRGGLSSFMPAGTSMNQAMNIASSY